MNPGISLQHPDAESLAMSARARAFVMQRLKCQPAGDVGPSAEPENGASDSPGADAEVALAHAEGCARVLIEIHADPAAVAAAWMFGLPQLLDLPLIEREFGADIARIVESMRKSRRTTTT